MHSSEQDPLDDVSRTRAAATGWVLPAARLREFKRVPLPGGTARRPNYVQPACLQLLRHLHTLTPAPSTPLAPHGTHSGSRCTEQARALMPACYVFCSADGAHIISRACPTLSAGMLAARDWASVRLGQRRTCEARGSTSRNALIHETPTSKLGGTTYHVTNSREIHSARL